jgi:ATP/maltotriose-dependent transcriptional regulator MalT
VWAALADAELQRGDLEAAKRAATGLKSAAATTRLPLARALAARTQAAMLLAGDRPDEAAETASRDASAIAQATPLQAARLRAIEGTARARGGNRQDGVALLKQAADEFERSGAQRLRHKALRELRRLGVRTWRRGVTTPPDAAGLDALSPREREVAALVLAGKRNTDIARELFLSLKTIESHTRNIYAKLGVSSASSSSRASANTTAKHARARPRPAHPSHTPSEPASRPYRGPGHGGVQLLGFAHRATADRFRTRSANPHASSGSRASPAGTSLGRAVSVR